MEDRFKFRIWDKFCETWLTDFAINQDGEINRFFNNKEALKRRFVLMQCTGLKDKNGKLIYEGDIFRTTEGCRGKEYSCYLVVKYSEGCYSLDGSYTTSGNTVKFVNYDLRDVTWDLQDSELFELVGNIYENPEFLD
jgi:uncharacterized phage protein (TIGR01671 family)